LILRQFTCASFGEYKNFDNVKMHGMYVKKKRKQTNSVSCVYSLTLILLTWRIWWAYNDASRWQMGFNSVFKGL